MSITAENFHTNLTIDIKHRHLNEKHKDDFNHWRNFLLKKLEIEPCAIESEYDVVFIRRHGIIVHTHYLMYSNDNINAVFSTFNLTPKKHAFDKVVLANEEFKQSLTDNTLYFILNRISENEWEGRIESKRSGANIHCKTP